jgi:Histidine kinase-like ATPase domain
MGSDTGSGYPHRDDDETGQPSSVPAVVPADAPGWQRVFEGDERELGVMRRWLVSVLPECSARDDVISVATELGSNALRHTASGDGGWFAVEVTWQEPVVRVGVTDGGGPAEPRVIDDPDGEHGRGLLLVQGLSLRTGVTGDQHGRLVWAEITWNGPPPGFVALADWDEAAIREDEAALARRFAGVPAWFGRATREWWALASPTELVAAPTASELAVLLDRLLKTQRAPRHDPAAHVHPDEVAQHVGPPYTAHRSVARPRLGPRTGHVGEGREPDDRLRRLGAEPGWPMATGWPHSAAFSGF